MKLIKQLDWFIKRQKRTYIVAIILLIITGVVDMLPPWIIGQADRRTDSVGVVLDDIWAGIFAAAASILAAGLSHGVM